MKTSIISAVAAAILLVAAAPASAGGYNGGYGHGYGYKSYGHKSYGHQSYYGGHGHCFVKKIKVYGHYGWSWKFVKQCY